MPNCYWKKYWTSSVFKRVIPTDLCWQSTFFTPHYAILSTKLSRQTFSALYMKTGSKM